MAILELLKISFNEDNDDVNRVGRIKAIVFAHNDGICRMPACYPFAPTTVGIEHLL